MVEKWVVKVYSIILYKSKNNLLLPISYRYFLIIGISDRMTNNVITFSKYG